jgi:hypothetical protein
MYGKRLKVTANAGFNVTASNESTTTQNKAKILKKIQKFLICNKQKYTFSFLL